MNTFSEFEKGWYDSFENNLVGQIRGKISYDFECSEFGALKICILHCCQYHTQRNDTLFFI